MFKRFFKKHLLLIIILMLYISLVFFNFFQQGLVNWDEAYFVVVSHTFSKSIRTAFSHPSQLFSSAYYLALAEGYGNVYTAGKPIYILFSSIIDAVWRSEYSVRFISVIAGIFIIIFFYKILDFYQLKRRVKIASVFLLALSPFFLTYSRLGLSQILSACLLLISLFFLLKFKISREQKHLRLSAVFTSFLLLSHYNTFLLVLILVLYSLFLLYRNRGRVRAYIFYFFFLLFIPLAWEGITQLGVRLALKFNFPAEKVFSYSGEILNQFRIGGSADTRAGIMLPGSFLGIHQPLYYVKLLFFFEGFIIFALGIVGLIFVIKNIKQFRYHIVFLLGFFSLGVFSLLILAKYPRNIIAILPLLYLFAALGLAKVDSCLLQKIGKKGVFVLLFMCVLVVGLNLNQYLNIFNIRTGFHKIADFLKKSYQPDDIQIYSSCPPIWRVYLPGYKAESIATIPLEETLKSEERKTIIIEDYFTKIEEQEKHFEGYPKQLIGQYKTNVFKVKPIILDHTYREEEFMEELFKKNTPESEINVYEIMR